MPTENKLAAPEFDLSDADGGRGYIAHLFKTVLRRHDYRQYITERLAGDFACTLAQHFEDIKARETALQQLLTAADEREDVLKAENKRLDLMVSQADYNYDLDRMQFKSRIDVLEKVLRKVRQSCHPKHIALIDAALKPAQEKPE